MSDLVKRLRWGFLKHPDGGHYTVNPDGPEAADRIDALEAENKALREALQWYVDNDETNEGGDWEEINEFWLEGLRRARALLAKDNKSWNV